MKRKQERRVGERQKRRGMERRKQLLKKKTRHMWYGIGINKYRKSR
jgi:hypothetical protein